MKQPTMAHEQMIEVSPGGEVDLDTLPVELQELCQAEARDIVAARAAGTPLAQIIADIDATYGQITAAQETDA